MAQIPYADSNGTLSVEVTLKHAGDVFLVDSANYQRYQHGQKFTYYGGHYNQNPVRITVSGIGRWYLIVNTGARESYNYRFY